MDIDTKAQRAEQIKEERNQADQTPIQYLVPPGFYQVVSGIYRSGFPTVGHLDIYDVLSVKTICSMTTTDYNISVDWWMARNHTQRVNIPVMVNEIRGLQSPYETIDRLLPWMLRPEFHPVVIHCQHGMRQTSCLVGCFRKVQGWTHGRIMNEYREYSGGGHDSALDEEFIQNYVPSAYVRSLASMIMVACWKPAPELLTSNTPFEMW